MGIIKARRSCELLPVNDRFAIVVFATDLCQNGSNRSQIESKLNSFPWHFGKAGDYDVVGLVGKL